MRLAVLMYHAIYRDAGERAALAAEERPYAVSLAEFARTLDLIGARRGLLAAPEQLSGLRAADDATAVLISFDDGHGSAYRHAFPLLAERGVQGIFFVTCDFIDRRPGYCRWDWLAEMAAGGMQIQSHGLTHRFLNDLDEEQLRRELLDSRRIIEAHTGRGVDSISFPGGRYAEREMAAARACGYRHCFGSRFGTHRLRGAEVPFEVRRIAVRAGMRPEQAAAFALGEKWPLVRRHTLEAVKAGARRVLGNRAYHALYRRWAGR